MRLESEWSTETYQVRHYKQEKRNDKLGAFLDLFSTSDVPLQNSMLLPLGNRRVFELVVNKQVAFAAENCFASLHISVHLLCELYSNQHSHFNRLPSRLSEGRIKLTKRVRLNICKTS